MRICAYCGRELVEESREHVFPRAIGGDQFTVKVHSSCNAMANHTIDMKLLRCAQVLAARAELGLTSVRGTEYFEVLRGQTVDVADFTDLDGSSTEIRESFGPPGVRVSARIRRGHVEPRLFGNPVQDRTGITHVYKSADEAPHVDIEGEPRRIMFVAELRRVCSHGDDTWERFTAKAGLALIDRLAQSAGALGDGYPIADILATDDRDRVARHLRHVAFGEGVTEPLIREAFLTEPSKQTIQVTHGRPGRIHGQCDARRATVRPADLPADAAARDTWPTRRTDDPNFLNVDFAALVEATSLRRRRLAA